MAENVGIYRGRVMGTDEWVYGKRIDEFYIERDPEYAGTPTHPQTKREPDQPKYPFLVTPTTVSHQVMWVNPETNQVEALMDMDPDGEKAIFIDDIVLLGRFDEGKIVPETGEPELIISDPFIVGTKVDNFDGNIDDVTLIDPCDENGEDLPGEVLTYNIVIVVDDLHTMRKVVDDTLIDVDDLDIDDDEWNADYEDYLESCDPEEDEV